jgi:biopolymer transport protein ExbD
MADIAFLLIIFFALTASFEVDRQRMALPRTVLRRDVPRNAAWVVVGAGGALAVSDGRAAAVPVAGPAELRQAASHLLARDPGRAFVLKADRSTPYRAVEAAVEALRDARVGELYLLSEPRRRPAARPAGRGTEGAAGHLSDTARKFPRLGEGD